MNFFIYILLIFIVLFFSYWNTKSKNKNVKETFTNLINGTKKIFRGFNRKVRRNTNHHKNKIQENMRRMMRKGI